MTIESLLDTFEKRLAQELHSSVDFIEAIGDDLVAAGGKRLRPRLAFIAGELLAAEQHMTMPVALAVELLHSASLLHDDLIDDADTRRGHEAAFRRYGNVVSVMSGDFMLAKVLGLLAQAGSSAFTQLMSDTAAQICEAEVLQFQTATLETYAFETYFKIIEGKTAVLFAAALEGVAILRQSPALQREALRGYGLHYGRAFQMRDDYLDLLGDPETLGKPIGGDLHEGKATYPILCLLERNIERVSVILKRHAREAADIQDMIDLVIEHQADRETRERIHNEVEQAIAYLDNFDDSPGKRMLIELAQQEVKRLT